MMQLLRFDPVIGTSMNKVRECLIAHAKEIEDKGVSAKPSVPEVVPETIESPAASGETVKSRSDVPSASRLVIRIKIPSDAPRAATARPRLGRGALALILVTVAVALGWFGISMFRAEPTSPESLSPAPAPAASAVAPAVSDEPGVKPASETAVTGSTPPSPVNEVIPDAPRSALETIRGTVRVSVRVIVGKDGAVVAATPDDPGPSRYFARLAIEAARKWTFTPSDSEEQRVMLLRFNFRRSGTTARASALQ